MFTFANSLWIQTSKVEVSEPRAQGGNEPSPRSKVPVTLQTQRESSRAAALYSRLGFRRVGETEHHFLVEWVSE